MRTTIADVVLRHTAGSGLGNGDEHRSYRSQSCREGLLTIGDLTF